MFTLPDLPYNFDALEPHIDKTTMELHHDKHHAAYVKNLNEALAGHDDLLNMEIERLLQNLDQVPENIRTKVRNNGGGHYNHSLFWQWLAPNSGGEPTEAVAEAITTSFGNFKSLKEKFTQAALGRFGSGWVWVVSKEGSLTILDTANQDSPITEGLTPILGLDVWEHAYYLKYQNRRAEYIEAWWNVINWEMVNTLLKAAR